MRKLGLAQVVVGCGEKRKFEVSIGTNIPTSIGEKKERSRGEERKERTSLSAYTYGPRTTDPLPDYDYELTRKRKCGGL